MYQMQNKQQFEQLMLQYSQLKNGSEEIRKMIIRESFDEAISMLKSRENLFLSCKCMRKFLELSDEQDIELNKLLDELKTMELSNIRLLEEAMSKTQREIKIAQQNEKIQNAYEFNENQRGSIINYTE